ncbi:MAG: beta-lactamase family protein [Saprospiraceae bacterium]|nr:beta-lactamase family protein [Saprospiraceae bacterium]
MITFILVTQFVVPIVGNSQDSTLLRIEIDKIIRFDTDINFKEVPGFVIGIIEGDAQYFFSYGKKWNEKKSIPPDQHDIYEIGSITKLYTAQILQILESENIISFNQKINDFIPQAYVNPRFDHLVISDLINHKSGLPLRPHLFGKKEKETQNPYAYYTKEDLLAFYRDYIPEKEGFVYSHTNYALLEIIIEKATGMDYDDVFKKYLTLPIGLQNTFVDFPEQKENLTAPGFDRTLNIVKPWGFSSFRASEGVKTSVAGAVSFLSYYMKLSETSDSLSTTESPVQTTIIPGLNEHLFIENGWHILNIKGKKIGIHTGRTSGHSCFMGMVQETKTAVVIFSNSWIGTGDLGLQILRMINQNWQ